MVILFYDAAVDFISHAYKDDKRVPFNEFINSYYIWDFGENFYTDRDNRKIIEIIIYMIILYLII